MREDRNNLAASRSINRIVINGPARNEFHRAQHTCEVVDAAGNRLGTFTPHYVGFECPTSDEELDRIQAEGGGRALADILPELEGRAKSLPPEYS